MASHARALSALRALIFDSAYDQYCGVVSSVRVMDGVLRSRSRIRYMQAGTVQEVEEIGVRTPDPSPVDDLGPGDSELLLAYAELAGQQPMISACGAACRK